jgi:hypothetical protein
MTRGPKLPRYAGQAVDGNVFSWIVAAAGEQRARNVMLDELQRAATAARYRAQLPRSPQAELQGRQQAPAPDPAPSSPASA